MYAQKQPNTLTSFVICVFLSFFLFLLFVYFVVVVCSSSFSFYFFVIFFLLLFISFFIYTGFLSWLKKPQQEYIFFGFNIVCAVFILNIFLLLCSSSLFTLWDNKIQPVSQPASRPTNQHRYSFSHHYWLYSIAKHIDARTRAQWTEAHSWNIFKS